MRRLQTLLLAVLLGLVGCSKGPTLKLPPTEPGPAVSTAPKGPSPAEQAARAAIEQAGGRLDKEVARGMPGLRIELPKSTTDADLKRLLVHLKAFPRIDELDLSETGVTAAGLAELKGLPNLRSLAVPEPLLQSPILREIGESAGGDFSFRGPFKPVSGPIKEGK